MVSIIYLSDKNSEVLEVKNPIHIRHTDSYYGHYAVDSRLFIVTVSLLVDTYITFSTYCIYVFFRKLTLTFRSGSLRFDLVRDF